MSSDFDFAISDQANFGFQEADDPGPTLNVRGSTGQTLHDSIGVGDIVENCRLVAILGNGSSGQAFLAEEIGLGNRPVVLKIAVENRQEHLNLARLQHTNIMPLFWSRRLHAGRQRVLAMPYLAKTTLADLLRGFENITISTRSGQRVFDFLQEAQGGLPIRIAVDKNHAQVLRQSTWVQFVVRMGQTLAEALAYAHQRNVLHLDIKPTNIVLTPDGQPILLDLDVAHSPLSAGDAAVPWFGGTPAFMSPEQLAAMEALTRNQPIPMAVDRRADLYSLGLVLYQALGGNILNDQAADPRQLPRVNPHVGRELAEILVRCLAEKPEDRYPDCGTLAEDLSRHLRSLPLLGVRTRLTERWRKWRRRRPLGLPVAGLLVSFCVAASLAGFYFLRGNEERRTQAESALIEGQEWQRKGQHEAAVQRFLAGKKLAESTYGCRPLRDHLARRLHNAQRLQSADELNKVVHVMRFYSLQEHTPRRLQHVLEAAGRKLWAKRGLLLNRTAGKLEPAIEHCIDNQLQELVLLWSDLQMRLAPAPFKESVRAEVVKVIAQAEAEFGKSFVLRLAREQYSDEAEAMDQLEPQTSWEFCALGRIALANGKIIDAGRCFEQAVDRDPLDFGANLHASVGWMRENKYSLAVKALSFCIGKDPSAECLQLRGEALAALGELNLALRDFSLALEKNQDLASAYQLRGDTLVRLGRPDDAAIDFERARKLNE